MEDNKGKFGPGYYIIVMVAVLKDMLDVINTLLGLAFSATAVLLPLGVFLNFLTSITGFLLGFVIFMYFWAIGVKFDKKKILTIIASVFVEIIPFLDMLPMETICVLAVRYFDVMTRIAGALKKKKGSKEIGEPIEA
jgi:hypothetical protein